jgi:glycosyltransferase involved in cell wall biosynthesis
MRISAILTTYNYARYLPEALESALSQEAPGHELEVILVDDGSTDGTREAAAAFAGRIRYIHRENGGQGSAFNAGFAAATGEIFCMLDGDDVWAPGKLSRVAAAFAADPALGLIRHYMEDMDSGGRPLPRPAQVKLPADDDLPGLLRSRLFTIGTSALSFRASALRPLLPIPTEVRICPDEYLFSLLVLKSRIKTIPEYLSRRRLHASNAGLYGHNLLNPANLRAFITTRETLDSALLAALKAAGREPVEAFFSLSKAHVARARVLLAALEGNMGAAFAEASRWRSSCGRSAYSFFKYLTMLLACASPRLYAALFAFYDRGSWPAALRRALTGPRE